MRWTGLAALALCLCAGCITFKPNSAYYTLDMKPSGAAMPPVGLEIQSSTVAEAVSRKEIYIQKSPTQVEYYATAQWVAGLDSMVADKLATEFGVPDPAKPSYRVAVHVADFGQVDRAGGADALATLVVTFFVPGNSGDPAHVATYSERLAAEDMSADAVVQALSRCVEHIAARIAADAAALPPHTEETSDS